MPTQSVSLGLTPSGLLSGMSYLSPSRWWCSRSLARPIVDDLSPAPDAWSRPDIPLHARAMYKMTRDGLEPESTAKSALWPKSKRRRRLAYRSRLGDVVGTGSSRKSAANSVLYFGQPVTGVSIQMGVCIGGKIAPIFYNTMEDAGALVSAPQRRWAWAISSISVSTTERLATAGDVISEFELRSTLAGREFVPVVESTHYRPWLDRQGTEALARAPSLESPICPRDECGLYPAQKMVSRLRC